MKKLKKVLKRICQVLLVIVILFLLYCLYISSGHPNIKVDYAAEMLKLVKPVDDESQNAAHLYQKAIDSYKKPGKVLGQIEKWKLEEHKNIINNENFDQNDINDLPFICDFRYDYLGDTNEEFANYDTNLVPIPENLRPYLKEFYEDDFLDSVRDKTWVTELTEEELMVLKQWLNNNKQTIEYLRQASEKSYCWWERECPEGLFSILLPEIKLMIEIKDMMSWNIKFDACKSDYKTAFEDLLVLHRIGEHYTGSRMIYEQLVGLSFQCTAVHCGFTILSHKDVESSDLLDLIKEYEKLTYALIHPIDYHVEQLFFDDFLQRCFTDNGRGGGHMIPSELKEFSQSLEDWWHFDRLTSLGASMLSANRKNLKKISDECYQKYQNYAEKTPYQLISNGIEIHFENETDSWSLLKKARYWPYVELLPSLGYCSEIVHMGRIESRAFFTVAALQHYEKTNGQFPDTLDELVNTGLIKELPMDPYSDEPLIYRRIENGFVLYSVGANFIDDGGVVYEYDEWGDEDEGGDRVFWPISVENSDELFISFCL